MHLHSYLRYCTYHLPSAKILVTPLLCADLKDKSRWRQRQKRGVSHVKCQGWGYCLSNHMEDEIKMLWPMASLVVLEEDLADAARSPLMSIW